MEETAATPTPAPTATPVPPTPAPTEEPAKIEGAEYFTGTAKGFGGDVEVTIAIKDGKIVDVAIAGDSETAGIGTNAIDELPAAIIAAQSAKVDTISGATVTSNAIIEAAEAAIAQTALAAAPASEPTAAPSPEATAAQPGAKAAEGNPALTIIIVVILLAATAGIVVYAQKKKGKK